MPFRVAVLIPCFNEAVTIGKVVADFRATLPHAEIYVFDNNSTDGTADAARRAGLLGRSVKSVKPMAKQKRRRFD